MVVVICGYENKCAVNPVTKPDLFYSHSLKSGHDRFFTHSFQVVISRCIASVINRVVKETTRLHVASHPSVYLLLGEGMAAASVV
jgi:hypothetical protein